MARPEPHLPTRRRQILDDRTGGKFRLDRREYEDTWPDEDSLVPGDAWVKNFVGRLAALVHRIGGKN
jgi:hypothetical protein